MTLSGQLLEDGIVPIPGRTLTLSLGAQSCTGVTDALGNASCSFVVNVSQGPQPLKAEFAGDAFYLPSSDTSKQAIVFVFPAKGAFLLGDRTVSTASPTTKLIWWGAQWAKQNKLSGGAASNSFKGFSENPSSNPPGCGGTWLTTPGNSPHPPRTVPSYMGVLVTDKVSKSGSSLSGNIVKIIVVKTDPGYGAHPGHSGTGKIEMRRWWAREFVDSDKTIL